MRVFNIKLIVSLVSSGAPQMPLTMRKLMKIISMGLIVAYFNFD